MDHTGKRNSTNINLHSNADHDTAWQTSRV